jgi:hypothetical protein
MSAVVQQKRPVTSSPASVPAVAPSPPKEQQTVPTSPVSTSTAWAGDRVALAVWVMGACIMAFLLLRDLFFALVMR